MARRVVETRFFGASVAGPGHRSVGRPNEDRWAGRTGRRETIVAVSDGVGSAPQAARGSAGACAAALQALPAWRRAGYPRDGSWSSDIQHAWKALVAPTDPSACQATCLVAVARPDGVLSLAMIGDGMVVIRRLDRSVEWLLGPRSDGFAGETDALGGSGRWSEISTSWRPGDVALIATDGVSDDVITERAGDLAHWLVSTFGPLPAEQRWRAIAKELRGWPTPGHRDDKTIVALTAVASLPDGTTR